MSASHMPRPLCYSELLTRFSGASSVVSSDCYQCPTQCSRTAAAAAACTGSCTRLQVPCHCSAVPMPSATRWHTSGLATWSLQVSCSSFAAAGCLHQVTCLPCCCCLSGVPSQAVLCVPCAARAMVGAGGERGAGHTHGVWLHGTGAAPSAGGRRCCCTDEACHRASWANTWSA